MKKTDLEDLLATVEEVRQRLYPDFDAGFLEAVVRAEESNPEDDSAALATIEQALGASLEAMEEKD